MNKRMMISLGFVLPLLLTACQASVTNNAGYSSSSDSVDDTRTAYHNAKHSYSTQYPADWTVREFEGTKDGAAFTPPDTTEGEVVTIVYMERPEQYKGDAFEDYVKIAATQEIQGHETLESIEEIETDDGVTCFMTTWMIQDTAGEYESGPITYCPAGPDATIQIALKEGSDEEDIYEEIIETIILPGDMESFESSSTSSAEASSMASSAAASSY